jgi:hypothetical protein
LKVVKTDAGATLATYTYGASNQRLKTVDNSVTNTWYVWEGGKVIAEYNDVSGAVSWAKSYVYLGERLLATESTGIALQFHHPDRLGTRLVTNASDGSSAGEQETLPFGTALGAGISGNNRRFTSYDRSTTTKLDYAVNRTCHPVQRYAEKRGKERKRETFRLLRTCIAARGFQQLLVRRLLVCHQAHRPRTSVIPIAERFRKRVTFNLDRVKEMLS